MRDLLTPSAQTLEAPSLRAISRTAIVAALGFGIYGFTMGYWRSPMMGCYVAVKMPLLIACSLDARSMDRR